jgi:predicted 2-oxoglutarate/Fe(II)-dependent dioxygenase YbiX
MQKVLFNKEECLLIIDSIKNSVGTSDLDIESRKYKEWLIVDNKILNLILEKLKVFGVENFKEGRILRYETGCFFDRHVDTWEKYPHRYKTIVIQLSDENDYEGGVMSFGEDIFSKKIGNTVIFEGTIKHGMEKVTSGTRYAFVIWLERGDFGIKKIVI